MTKKDVLKIIRMIEEFYNNPWSKKSYQQMKQNGFIDQNETPEKYLLQVVNFWYEILKDYKYEPVVENLKKHVLTSKFTPTIAELIHDQYRDPSRPYNNPETLSDEELRKKWGLT